MEVSLLADALAKQKMAAARESHLFFKPQEAVCKIKARICNSSALNSPGETSDKPTLKGSRKGAVSELCSNFLWFMCWRVFSQSPGDKCEFHI